MEVQWSGIERRRIGIRLQRERSARTSSLRRPTDGREAAAAQNATTSRAELKPNDWQKPAAVSFSGLGGNSR
jgi:hypothetical protein